MAKCVDAAEMVATIYQTQQLGWTVNVMEKAVQFTRPDGVFFHWDWVTSLAQFCMAVPV